jgi:phosphopantetheine adenylyltransferase
MKFSSNVSVYRVIQEERSIFWEVIVSVIVRKEKKNTLTCVTKIELFESTNDKFVMVHNKCLKIPRITCSLCTCVAKRVDVDSGIIKHLLCNKSVI